MGNRSRRIMLSPRALSWDHSYSLYIQRPWVVWSVGITSATICTLMTHRFSFLFPKQILRCHCRWSSSASKPKLNPDKTEFILIGTKAQWDKFKKYFPTKLLDQDVTPTDSARNLGVEFDKDFNFKKHISKVCRSCYYHIRDLRRLRRCLTAAVTKTIATSLVLSKVDYCNSILYNIPNREINKVQSVQNCLARVVTRSPRFCSVTPLLKSLHWLPV